MQKWSFMFAHASCEQCNRLRLDAIMTASARNEDAGATYTDSAGHSATAYKKSS